jgi:hypothetical protein
MRFIQLPFVSALSFSQKDAYNLRMNTCVQRGKREPFSPPKKRKLKHILVRVQTSLLSNTKILARRTRADPIHRFLNLT